MLGSTAPRQLLQAWNPLTEPLTVKTHVDALSPLTRKRGFLDTSPAA